MALSKKVEAQIRKARDRIPNGAYLIQYHPFDNYLDIIEARVPWFVPDSIGTHAAVCYRMGESTEAVGVRLQDVFHIIDSESYPPNSSLATIVDLSNLLRKYVAITTDDPEARQNCARLAQELEGCELRIDKHRHFQSFVQPRTTDNSVRQDRLQ